MKPFILKLLSIYKKYFSLNGSSCRFSPTCSVYTYQAIKKYGTIKGIIKGLGRIIRCNPFNKGGYDPLV